MVCAVQIVNPLNSHHLPSLHMFTMSAFSRFHVCDNCGTLSPRRAMVSGRGPMNLMPAASPGTIRITSRSQRRGAQLRQHFLPHQNARVLPPWDYSNKLQESSTKQANNSGVSAPHRPLQSRHFQTESRSRGGQLLPHCSWLRPGRVCLFRSPDEHFMKGF